MPFKVKWAELLKYQRNSIFIILSIFVLSIMCTLLIPPWGSNITTVFLYIILVTGLILGLLLIILIFFKLLEVRALKKRINWITSQLASQENEILEKLEIAVIEYYTELGEETCSICTLLFEEKARVIQCLICEKLYHEEHFIEWIKENENCPYCKNLILPFD